MKKRWKTEDMRKLLEDPRWTIKDYPYGGDVDSNGFILRANDAVEMDGCGRLVFLHVSGVLIEEPMFCLTTDRDDCDVHAVEVTDGLDSRGGLNTNDRATRVMYDVVTMRLLELGWKIIGQVKDHW